MIPLHVNDTLHKRYPKHTMFRYPTEPTIRYSTYIEQGNNYIVFLNIFSSMGSKIEEAQEHIKAAEK